jgi:peptidoglycan hydrolase-like protein with peptidoglycan-binding domain
MNTKKIISVALTATTVVWALGVASLPLAQAQSTSSLQAQIAALLAQIQQLQSQLNGSTSGSSMTYDFTSDLTVGSTGADVSSLQQLLINKGYLTAVSAPTGYFGTLTQAAVAAFQAANGITPAAGYFGPKTRAFVNSMSTGTGTGTSTGTGTGTSTVTPPATGLSVSVDAQSPVNGSLVTSASGNTSAARIPVLALDFTASNAGAVTVTDIKVNKLGVLSDSSIGGAYLIQNGQVLYQYNSLNQGVLDFSGLNFSVPAGQTETLWVAIDPSPGLSAGNTVSFSVNAATDVTAWDASNNAITPSGAFPLNGSTFTATTVNNPSLAGLNIQSSSIATQVTAGTQNNIVGAWTFTGSNSLIWLKGIKFTVIGSANMSDLQNVKLFVNGTQVGATLASIPQGGAAYFDLSSAPATLNTGNNNVQVYADVMGSPNKNFNFEVLNSYDVDAVDSQYNVPIAIQTLNGTDATVQIQQGQITTTQDTNTPTGNVAVGQSGVTLAKFDIYAAGEPVKVKFLGFALTFSGLSSTSSMTLAKEVQNIAIVDDAGGQVGTTINNPPSSNSCDTNTSGVVAAGYSTTGAGQSAITATTTVTYVDCFGTSASPINYIVPANTTRVLSLKADIQSTANFSTVVAQLLGESNNLQGMISSAQNSSSGAQGSSLSLATSLLSATKNTAYGNQNITPNTAGAHVGSYAFTASSASGVQINTVSIKAMPGLTLNQTSDLQNLKIMVNGGQFGTTQGIVADQGTYTFSGAPFTVPAGGTTYVDVYADVLSSATSSGASGATILTGYSGTGVTSFNAISFSGSVTGQQLSIASGGATMTDGLDSSAPAASQLVMGSTGNSLAAFRFNETSNVENVKITDLKITQLTTATSSGYQNITLYNGSSVVGTSGSAATTSGGFTYTFHFATPVIVPQANSLTLTLKGDVASYNSQGANDNTTSTFGIAATGDVTALGASSNLTTHVTGTAIGNTMTILRTVLTPSATALGSTSGRTKSSADNLAQVSFTANSAGAALLRTLVLTFSGNGIATSSATGTAVYGNTADGLGGNISLRDTNNNDVVTADAASGSVQCASQSACTVTWTFAPNPTSTGAFIISGGTTYNFTLQLNDIAGLVAAAGNGNAVSLGITAQASSSVTYLDAVDGTGSSILLPTTIVPLNITSMSFAAGS